ncbi:MAG: hypothetical protein IKU99_06930 [Clostridia bacterium]|nr:hypothetical protein [Clostridia bacterium]
MTCKIALQNKRRVATITCIMLCFAMLCLSKEMKLGALEGIRLSFEILIPTLFPFFVLSDYWSKNFYISEESFLSKLFVRLFHIPPCGFLAFITGVICGFPLGIKVACDLYSQGKINDRQLTILCGFCNNPSIAFVISGVGLGIFGSVRVGILLFISCSISAIICGVVFREKEIKTQKACNISRQKFSLVESIKNAGLTSITISSYVIFFSAMIYALRKTPLIASILELCSAVKIISESQFSINQKLILIAFSLGFSGLSVHLQAFSFMGENVKKSRYFLMKITQGLLTAMTIFIFEKAVSL